MYGEETVKYTSLEFFSFFTILINVFVINLQLVYPTTNWVRGSEVGQRLHRGQLVGHRVKVKVKFKVRLEARRSTRHLIDTTCSAQVNTALVVLTYYITIIIIIIIIIIIDVTHTLMQTASIR